MAQPNHADNILLAHKDFLINRLMNISKNNKDYQLAINDIIGLILDAQNFSTIKDIIKLKTTEGIQLDPLVKKQITNNADDPFLKRGIERENRINILLENLATHIADEKEARRKYEGENIYTTYPSNTPQEYQIAEKKAAEMRDFFDIRIKKLEDQQSNLIENKYNVKKDTYSIKNMLDTLRTEMKAFTEKISEKINQFRRPNR